MTKTLYVPDHVAQKVKEQKSKSSDLNNAYLDPNKKVLDPTLLEKPLLERLPQPTGWRILVMPYQGKATTEKGLHIPDHVREQILPPTPTPNSNSGSFVSANVP